MALFKYTAGGDPWRARVDSDVDCDEQSESEVRLALGSLVPEI
jgi:hypothetical protein